MPSAGSVAVIDEDVALLSLASDRHVKVARQPACLGVVRSSLSLLLLVATSALLAAFIMWPIDSAHRSEQKSRPRAVVGLAASSTASSILPHIVVEPYGVLGAQLQLSNLITEKVASPGSEVAVVDPAGLQYIQHFGPKGAGGASGAIYKWLGIQDSDAFPHDIRDSIHTEGDAKFHQYGQKAIIHVASPELSMVTDQAVARQLLATSYANVLREFVTSAETKLRLLPIASGIFAGPFSTELPELTFAALDDGFRSLPEFSQSALLDKLAYQSSIEMCIFAEAELDAYRDACPSCSDNG